MPSELNALLEELDALYARATLGGWERLCNYVRAADDSRMVCAASHNATWDNEDANLDLIAALHNAYPQLRAALQPSEPVPEGSWRNLIDRLYGSLRSGYLLGNYNEPLDEYGKRLVRVIVSAMRAAAPQQTGRWIPVDAPPVGWPMIAEVPCDMTIPIHVLRDGQWYKLELEVALPPGGETDSTEQSEGTPEQTRSERSVPPQAPGRPAAPVEPSEVVTAEMERAGCLALDLDKDDIPSAYRAMRAARPVEPAEGASETPETDAIWKSWTVENDGVRIQKMTAHAESLERQRNALRARLEAAERDYAQCKVALDDERVCHRNTIGRLRKAASEEIQAANKRAEVALQRTAALAQQLAHAEEAERDALEQFKRAMGEQATLAERVRETCAKVCEAYGLQQGEAFYLTSSKDCAKAIRTLDLSALTEEPRT